MRGRAIAYNGIWSLAAQVFWRGGLIAASMLLARHLSTSEFAAYSYFAMTITLLATYAALGMGMTATRTFAQAMQEGDERRAPVGTLITLSTILSLLLVLIVLLIPEGVLTSGLGVSRILLATGACVMSLGVVPGGAIVGVEKYRESAVSSALAGLLTLGGSWLAIVLGDPEVAMIAIVVGGFVLAACQYAIVGRAIGWRRMLSGCGLALAKVKALYEFAGPMMLVSAMAGSGAWLVGRMILSASGAAEFALYSIGMQWFALAVLLPNVVARVLFPRMVREADLGAARAKRTLVGATQLAMASAVVVGVFGVALGPWIARAYGSSYAGERWLIAAFMAAGLVNAPISTMGNALLAWGRQRTWAAVTGVWFVVLLSVAAAANASGQGAWSGSVAQGVANTVQLVVTIVVCKRLGLV